MFVTCYLGKNKQTRATLKRIAVTDMQVNRLKGDTINCVLAMLKFVFNISRIEMGQRKYINRRIVSVQTYYFKSYIF